MRGCIDALQRQRQNNDWVTAVSCHSGLDPESICCRGCSIAPCAKQKRSFHITLSIFQGEGRRVRVKCS